MCGTVQTAFLKIVFQFCQQNISTWNFYGYFQQQRLLVLQRSNGLLKSMFYCCRNSLYYIATMFLCCFIYKRFNLQTCDISMKVYLQRGKAILELVANKSLHWQFCIMRKETKIQLLHSQNQNKTTQQKTPNQPTNQKTTKKPKPKPNPKQAKQTNKTFSCCIIWHQIYTLKSYIVN